MNKRFASLAVSALLLVSMFSVPALAEGADAAADTAAASDDHVIVTLNPEAALQPETPADAEASATETAIHQSFQDMMYLRKLKTINMIPTTGISTVRRKEPPIGSTRLKSHTEIVTL